jgi:hypothetical protein
MRELVLAAFFVGFGMASAATLTHLVQAVSGQTLGFGLGRGGVVRRLSSLMVTAICGPYVLLQVGRLAEREGQLSVGPALVLALVAFGWAFISGLMLLAALINVGL